MTNSTTNTNDKNTEKETTKMTDTTNRRYYWDVQENDLIEKINREGTFVTEIEFEDDNGKIIIDVYRIALEESDAFPDGSRDILAFFKSEIDVEFYLSGDVAYFHNVRGGRHYNMKNYCWYTGQYFGPRALPSHMVTCDENLQEFFTRQR
tara:strand:+ start:70 stop:519 length:450 start_codon:yes stop_codon:yes gene_type:complete